MNKMGFCTCERAGGPIIKGMIKYDNGKLICKNIDDEGMETTTPETIDTLIEFCNNNEPGTGGTYEECVAYVSNGNVDAIKIFEK